MKDSQQGRCGEIAHLEAAVSEATGFRGEDGIICERALLHTNAAGGRAQGGVWGARIEHRRGPRGIGVGSGGHGVLG